MSYRALPTIPDGPSPLDSLPEQLRRRYRVSRWLLFGQGVLILAHAAWLPFQARSNFNNSIWQAASGPPREFMSVWMWIVAGAIGCGYVAVAVLTLIAAWKMRERSAWGWGLVMAAGIAGFTVGCMPFGLYSVWVVGNPVVRRAMGKYYDPAGIPSPPSRD